MGALLSSLQDQEVLTDVSTWSKALKKRPRFGVSAPGRSQGATLPAAFLQLEQRSKKMSLFFTMINCYPRGYEPCLHGELTVMAVI